MIFKSMVRLPKCKENVGLFHMEDRYGRTWYSYHRSGYPPTAPRQSVMIPAELETLYEKPPYTIKRLEN